MSIKWALGVAAAITAALFALPGIASADHHAHVNANTECDGTFTIDADYHASSFGPFQSNVYVDINGQTWDDAFGDPSNSDPDHIDIPGPYGTTIDQDISAYQIPGGMDDSFEYDNTADADDFFVMNGTYDNVVTAGGSITVDVDIVDSTNAGIGDSASVEDGLDGSWSECVEGFCIDGNTGVEQLSFQNTATNDCDPVRLCVDGDSLTVTEFDAENDPALQGADNGSCTPSEQAPPPPPAVEEEPAPTVVEETAPESEVAGVVAEAPEVVALPSAGSRDSGSGQTWLAAALALLLIGTGSGVALAARRR